MNGDGVFRVKDVRNLLDETFLPKADTPTRWIKCIPIKVNVFVWKALQDRLPTRSNLVRRNILIDSLSCPICDGEPEDSSHLFFRCCLARDVTRLVCRWWDLDFHSFNSYTDWQGWFKQLRLGAKSKEVLEGVFYVSWWSLWNFRNHLLFADSNPRKDAIFDEIVLRSFNWCLARASSRKRLKLRCSRRSHCSSHASIDTLLKRYPHLESLSLVGCLKVSNSALTQLRIFGSKLYSLNLSNCSNVSDIGITSMASGCPLLCGIHLSNCSISDSGLEIITKSCKYLEVVDLSWCKNITDRGIWSLNQNCRRVRSLNVCGRVKVVGLADLKANHFEDDAVMTISKECRLLHEWNLSFCYKIEVFGWESIGLYAQNLKILNVSYCDNLCSRGLTALYNGCKRLSVLYINKCLNISGSQILNFKSRNVRIIQEVSSTIVPTWAFSNLQHDYSRFKLLKESTEEGGVTRINEDNDYA
ncbi:RNA-directed DNA polymerase, eukaryota [Tanacetum coccineum]